MGAAGLSGCVWKVGALTHPGEHLHASEARLSGVWPLPAGACLPDAPGGLSVEQTLHLNTNKWSEGSPCLSLNWKFVLVLSGTRRRGGSSQGQQVGAVGRCPIAFSLLPAQGLKMTWGTFPCIRSWAVLGSSLLSTTPV